VPIILVRVSILEKPSHEKHKDKSKGLTYKCAVMTVSTSRYGKYGNAGSPGECDDESGGIIVDLLAKAGHRTSYRLLPDDRLVIERCLMDMLSDADAAIVCGGTGLTASDVTIEAVTPMLQKAIPGFGELFRIKSYEEVGTASMLTRAMAGSSRTAPCSVSRLAQRRQGRRLRADRPRAGARHLAHPKGLTFFA